jgi:hypothetical protein
MDVFESEVISDLRQMAENALKYGKIAILHFFLRHSKKPKVTWTHIRRIRWMKTAYAAFQIKFFLDFATIMTFE